MGNAQNYRIKEEYRKSLHVSRLTIASLRHWYAARFSGVKLISPRTVEAAKKGGVVNHHAMVTICRYLNRHSVQDVLMRPSGPASLSDFDAGPFAIETIGEQTLDRTTAVYRSIDFWKQSWSGLLDSAKSWRAVRIDERLTVPQSEDEVREAAELILRAAGRSIASVDFSSGTAVEAGQNLLRRTVDELADWLIEVWKANPRSVMFSVARPEGRSPIRCGVTVFIPLSEGVFDALHCGAKGLFAIGREDIRSPSRNILFFALSDLPTDLPAVEAGNARFTTGLYQLVMLTPRLLSARCNLRMMCPEARRENIEKSRTFAFHRTGAVFPDINIPIAVLANPSDRLWARHPAPKKSFKDLISYYFFVGSIVICQGIWARAHTAVLRANRQPNESGG